MDGLQSLVLGGYGLAVLTQVSLASGEPIATDVVVLGLMKALRWSPVTTKGMQEQVQIQHAMSLRLGARGLEEVELVSEYHVGGHDCRKLVEAIKQHIGLT
jgi:hypothetical protein